MSPRLIALFVTLLAPALAGAQQSGSTIATERIFEAIGVREGITVCELVGPGGRVYTSELGEERVKALRSKVEGSELKQITVVEGDPVKTNFPEGVCDALFMRNVYHHFTDPAKINGSIAASMKPGARLAVVDFTPPDKEAERPADRSRDGMHGVTPETVSRELGAAGFQSIAAEAGAQRWFLVVATRPGSLTP